MFLEPNTVGCGTMKLLIKPVLLLTVSALFIFEFVLHRHCGVFREFEGTLYQEQWVLAVFLGIWCGSFVFLTFSRADWPLIGLLLIIISAYFIGYAESSRATDAVILLAGVTLGKFAFVLLRRDKGGINAAHVACHSSLVTFLIGLVVLLTFASWWHLDMTDNFYHGPRWMGLWDNPNIYGMLMGAGVVLAAGLLVGERSRPGCRSPRPASNLGNASDEASLAARGARALPIFLFIAVGMMAVGLFFSYSRGAWVGTAVGLLYLAKARGKFNWRFILPGIFVAAAAVVFFWHSTADTDAWYVKRLDLSRPSAQHRVSAWHGAFQMMRDHPLGVGWNKAVGVYDKNYSPPEGGAAALTMNSYLMLGTELGLPGLLCFVGYVGLCYRKSPRPYLAVGLAPSSQPSPPVGEKVPAGRMRGNPPASSSTTCHLSHQTACRAGALALLVAFWFDGGLFTLATAAVFWILLELGAETQKRSGVVTPELQA